MTDDSSLSAPTDLLSFSSFILPVSFGATGLADCLSDEARCVLAWNARSTLGLFLIAVACSLAVTVGVGGGGLFVPLMILVLQITPREAVALSQSLMAGGSLAALFLNMLYTRHPHKIKKPVLDAQLVLLLGPVQMGGALIGVVANRVSPAWLILLCLTISLFYSSIRVLRARMAPPGRRPMLSTSPPVTGVQTKTGDTTYSVMDHSMASTIPTPSLFAVPDTPSSLTTTRSNSLGTAHAYLVASTAAQILQFGTVDGNDDGTGRRFSDVPSQSYNSPFYPIAVMGLSPISTSVCVPGIKSASPASALRVQLLPGGSRSPGHTAAPAQCVSRSAYCPPLISGEDRLVEVTLTSLTSNSTPTTVASVDKRDEQVPKLNFFGVRKKFFQKRTFWALVILGVVWVSNLLLLIARGGTKSKGLVAYCGVGYWLLGGLGVLVLLGCSLICATFYMRRRKTLQFFLTDTPSHRLMLEPVDFLTQSYSGALLLLVQTLFTGILAGTLGIGGGMLLAPILLSRGIHPLITTAANATLVLLTSSSATMSYILSGRTSVKCSLCLGFTCFIGALVGKSCLDRQLMSRDLSGYLVRLLVGVILSSMLAMIVSGVVEIHENGFTGFHSIC